MDLNKSVEEVALKLPRKESFSKIVRIATTAVANQAGLNIDHVDDLNTALEELFRLFMAGEQSDGKFSVKYSLYQDELKVAVKGVEENLFDDSNKTNRFSRFILERVADKFELVQAPEGGNEIIISKQLDR